MVTEEKKNAIVGQSGGPTAAINATLAGVIRGVLARDDIGELYGMHHGILGLLSDDLIPLRRYFPGEDALSLLAQTPAAALGSCRKKLPQPWEEPELYEEIFTKLREKKIGWFFYIGGNDSMDTVEKLSNYAETYHIRDVVFVGVPKTIDNDLMLTDHTPGYGSAAKYIAASVSEIVRDCAVYAVRSVTIVEIMGRDAGWLAASAALAGKTSGRGADYIYCPEHPFSDERFFEDIENAFRIHPNVVIAVSEGIRYADGEYVGAAGQSGVTDAFGHRYLSGTAQTLEHKVIEHFRCKVRSVEINILQRCAGHLLSETDIRESVSIGEYAVLCAAEKRSGVMVCMERDQGTDYHVHITAKPVRGAANLVRPMPVRYINADGNGVTDECLAYIRPLIAGEYSVLYEDGLPKHFVFS